MREITDRKMKLKIWHNSNFGHLNFEKDAVNLKEAKVMLDVLAEYDLYQGELIQCNAQGLLIFDDGEWVEWMDEKGDFISDINIEDI